MCGTFGLSPVLELCSVKRILGLQRRLLDRSVEAYIQSLETVNRLSLVYRIETFAWLICNAWELLLKAKIIDDSGSTKTICYRMRRGQPVRSLSLRDSMDKVFINDSDPTRRNLLLVEELRDQATHLVIRQVPHDVIGLFQACVVNYHNRLHEWFGWSLSQRVNVGMMSIVYDLGPEQFDLSSRILRRQLGKETAAFLTQFQARLQQEFDALGRPIEFSIGIDYKLALTQKPGDADIVLTKGEGGEATAVVEVPKDPSSTHPYRRTELVKRVNEVLGGSVTVTTHDIQCIVTNYNVKKRPEFFYQGRITGSPGQYSNRFVEWVAHQYELDHAFFTKQRSKAKGMKEKPALDASEPWGKPIADVQQVEEKLAELAPLARIGHATVDIST